LKSPQARKPEVFTGVLSKERVLRTRTI